MECGTCGASLTDDVRFCPQCGAAAPAEDPLAIAEYRRALQTLGSRTEAWAAAELAALRRELGVRDATHARLIEALSPSTPAPVSVWLDATTVVDFKVGARCLLRLRVTNESARALLGAELSYSGSDPTAPLEAATVGPMGPGESAVMQVWLRPAVAGHHTLTARLCATPMRGEPTHWQLAPVEFRVAGPGALQQSIHIDARNQRVGIFDNVGGSERGGLVESGDWRLVGLTAVAGALSAPAIVPAGPQVGARSVATVMHTGDELRCEVDGHSGLLIELEDPVLRSVIAVGDRLQVSVIGHDGAGRLLLSTRVAQREPSPEPPPRVTPQTLQATDNLAACLESAPPGSTITVTGQHEGPVRICKPVTLLGSGGATITTSRGAAVVVTADAVIEGLTVHGTAGVGQYAPDGIDVRGGRVTLTHCTVRTDCDDNLTPGRAVVVSGPATVKLTACTLHDSGVGLAVDVSWSGFPGDGAAGARVAAIDTHIHGCALGAAVAGPDRELHLVRCTMSGCRDGTVRVLAGATANLEDCTLPPGAASCDATSTLNERGTHR